LIECLAIGLHGGKEQEAHWVLTEGAKEKWGLPGNRRLPFSQTYREIPAAKGIIFIFLYFFIFNVS